MSPTSNEFDEAGAILRRHYRVLGEKLAFDVLDSRSEFEDSSSAIASDTLEGHARALWHVQECMTTLSHLADWKSKTKCLTRTTQIEAARGQSLDDAVNNWIRDHEGYSVQSVSPFKLEGKTACLILYSQEEQALGPRPAMFHTFPAP